MHKAEFLSGISLRGAGDGKNPRLTIPPGADTIKGLFGNLKYGKERKRYGYG